MGMTSPPPPALGVTLTAIPRVTDECQSTETAEKEVIKTHKEILINSTRLMVVLQMHSEQTFPILENLECSGWRTSRLLTPPPTCLMLGKNCAALHGVHLFPTAARVRITRAPNFVPQTFWTAGSHHVIKMTSLGAKKTRGCDVVETFVLGFL